MIEDAALPGLRDLAPPVLARMTGRADATLLRLRYRKGRKAILHVGGTGGEGVIWLFAGDKARRVARRNALARLDQETGAVFEAFPGDHRLPQIAALMQGWPDLARDLIGRPIAEEPGLLRYRPGLAATFRTRTDNGHAAFVKVVGDEDVVALAAENRCASGALHGKKLKIAPVLGIRPDLKAIGYARAQGVPLDRLLRGPNGLAALDVALDRMGLLGDMPPVSRKTLVPEALRRAAHASRDMLCTVFPELVVLAQEALARLDTTPEPTDSRMIHADMKLEHIFVEGQAVTLIDTETLAMGPVDYDLAMLWGRIAMAALDGTIQPAVAHAAQGRIVDRAGAGFDWCRAVVALRLAKFHAEHPAPDARDRAGRLLQALA
jgi:hypothetical protein